MADLKESDPLLYTQCFKDGVERAQSGSGPYGMFDILIRQDCQEAMLDGFRVATALGNTKK